MEDWGNRIAYIPRIHFEILDTPSENTMLIEDLYQEFKSRLLQELSEADLRIPAIDQPQEKKTPRKRFQKPTVAEIMAYCQERKNGIDAQAFFDHYETNGWVQGKKAVPIKNWQAAVRTWENRVEKKEDLSTKRTHASQKLWKP